MRMGKFNQWLRYSYLGLKRVLLGDRFPKIQANAPSVEEKTSPEVKDPSQGLWFFQKLFRKFNAYFLSVEKEAKNDIPIRLLASGLPPSQKDVKISSSADDSIVESKNAKVTVPPSSSVDLLLNFFENKYGKRVVQKDENAIPNIDMTKMTDITENETMVAPSKSIGLSIELPKKKEFKEETLEENEKLSKTAFSRCIYYKRLGPKQ